jgi:uncharacterized protein (DUF924 family)
MRQWCSNSSGAFGGGADSAIIERFAPLLERAARGELDYWAQAPRSRLALIVLDQFSRSLYRDTARAFAQDPRALALALDGIEIGHYAALDSPWISTPSQPINIAKMQSSMLVRITC